MVRRRFVLGAANPANSLRHWRPAALSVTAWQIAARAPRMADNDELSALAANTNARLDQVERLVDAQCAVSDQTAHEIRTGVQVNCSWQPDYTDRSDIRIDNRESVPATFYLLLR